MKITHEIQARRGETEGLLLVYLYLSSEYGPGAPNDRFLGNDLKWLVMHPGVL